jgi:hypothetical protein
LDNIAVKGIKNNAILKNKNPILIYPNPTTRELTITNYELGNGLLSEVEVEVFDIYGRNAGANLRVCPETETQTVINISHLPTGIYFVKIITEKGEIVKKVVKQ